MAARTSIIGQTLGRYRVLEQIGAGGMGLVFRAHDERLDRDVALKVLPPGTLSDENARRRFHEEARALSQLNHPNIGTIHDFDTQDGIDFLVMELVPGTTLDEKFKAGPLPGADVCRLGVQLAEGLAAAHRQGVIHRDLKPGNLRLTPDGRLKILDFGLAKLLRPVTPDADTESLSQTQGAVGTLPYMSPEQLRGRTADSRSDIWAVGCVLYEMATGRRPFQQRLSTALVDEIIHQAPPAPREVRGGVPAGLEAVILKALDKEPDHRYQSAEELGLDLRRLEVASSQAGMAVPAASGMHLLLWAATLLAIAALAAVGFLLRRRTELRPAAQQWVQLTHFTDSASSPALSPDGRMLAFIRGESTFIGPGQIYIKLLPDGEPKVLTKDPGDKMSPVFSPDGSRIAYTGSERWRWDSYVVPVLGSEPSLLLPNASGLTWVNRDQVMFSEITQGLYMKVATASESRAGERDVYLPPATEIGMAHRSSLSPDRRWVLVAEMDNRGWLPCRVVPFEGGGAGEPVGPVPAKCTNATWSPDGTWMYFSADSGAGFHLWRQRFPDGAPEQITSGATEEEGVTVDPDGRSLITAVGVSQSTVWLHDAQGERQLSSEGFAFTPTVSADGKKVYYLVRSGVARAFVAGELWVTDIEAGRSERLFRDFLITRYDVSRDGQLVAFAATDANGKSEVWLAPLNRRTPPRRLTLSEAYRPLFGPKGEIFLLIREGSDDYVYRMNPDGSEREKIAPQPVHYLINVSPDGRWVILWTTVKQAEAEVSQVVDAYPLGGGNPVRLCTGCGTGPANTEAPSVSWSQDQKQMYLVTSGRMGKADTVALPLRAGEAIPRIPAAGPAHVPGARVLGQSNIFPGPRADIYALMRTNTQRNLYRIPLP